MVKIYISHLLYLAQLLLYAPLRSSARHLALDPLLGPPLTLLLELLVAHHRLPVGRVRVVEELVDDGGAEFAGRDALFKERVELTVRPAAHLGLAEVGPDDRQETEARPEETGTATPVAASQRARRKRKRYSQLVNTQEIGHDDVVDDADNVVADTRRAECQSQRANLLTQQSWPADESTTPRRQ